MRFDYDEFNFKDDLEMMNLENQMKNNIITNAQNNTIGFNNDDLYNYVDKEIKKWE